MIKMQYVLYFAFLKQSVLEEAQESIYSFYEKVNAIQKIVLMTDYPEAFDSLKEKENLYIEAIPKDTVQKWIGTDNYVFNLKIWGLRYFFEKYDANALFFDSDTFLLKDCTPLFEYINPDNAVMLVSNPLPLHRLFKLNFGNMNQSSFIIKDRQLILGEDSTKQFNSSFYIFNSGVIGLSKSHKHLLDEILDVTKELCSYKLRGAEEIAFSLVLQRNGIKIIQCDDFVFHYFFAKWARFLLEKRRLPLDVTDMQSQFINFVNKYNINPNIISLIQNDINQLPLLIYFIDKELLLLDSIENDYFYMGGKGSYMANLKEMSHEKILHYIEQYNKL